MSARVEKDTMLHLQEELFFVKGLINELALSGVVEYARPNIDGVHPLKL